MRIALAAVPAVGRVDGALPWVEQSIVEAAERGARIVCFPEAYLPGLRGQDFTVEPHSATRKG